MEYDRSDQISRYSCQLLLSDGFGVLGQRKLLLLLVLAIGEGGIGPTLLLLLAASEVGRITVVEHDDMEVSNLHWQVIHTKWRRVKIKARYVRNAMRTLNPTVLVTATTETLT